MLSFYGVIALGMVMGTEYSSAFLAPNNSNSVYSTNKQEYQSTRFSPLFLIQQSMLDKESGVPSRRDVLNYGLGLAGLSYVALPEVSNAAPTTYKTFKDEALNFQFQVPESWSNSKQTLPDRRELILFVDESSTTPVMFLAYTPIRDDFTSLGSFGSVDQVASMTILPKGGKGSLMGGEEEINSKMIRATSKTNQYLFDYTMKTGGLPEMHYRSLWTLAAKSGSAGTNLVTITLQTEEAKYEGLKQAFDEVINSFGKLS
eukprot:CAMPEP_0116008912 /NCGR_PEP_ID=MMETSP0321-20121206/3132_1 /TAXON_ID=163516 /ORGANISM="Leptocylindrus danicus var. danicus, Strain B650" /LENGTH=258 /DNA_ID=CAMNT_0003477799 /DNA_START=82 /DNA_END=858 /DNA_ORIENTATION=-